MKFLTCGYKISLILKWMGCKEIAVFWKLTQRGAYKNWTFGILENEIPLILKLFNGIINKLPILMINSSNKKNIFRQHGLIFNGKSIDTLGFLWRTKKTQLL